jgi:hypothetical protein
VHYQKVHELYRPSSVARVVKCKRLQWLDIGLYRNKKLIQNLLGETISEWAIEKMRRKWDDDKMDLKIICRDGRWRELAQDRVQWRAALVLAMLNLRVLLPESQLISEMDLRETGCEDGRWMELAQDRVQWWALVLAVLTLWVLLPESQLISKMDLRETGCDDVGWMKIAQVRVQWRALV